MHDLFAELERPLTNRLQRMVGARARAALAAAHKAVTPRERPLILVLAAHIEDPRPYQSWIEAAGGEARVLERDRFEREIATADGLVMSGSQIDIDPALYG